MMLLIIIVALFVAAWLLLEVIRRRALELARASLYKNDFEKSLKFAFIAYRIPMPHPAVRLLILRFLANVLLQSGRSEEALAHVDDALSQVARRPNKLWNQLALSLLNLRSKCLEALGRFEEAAQCVDATLDVWAGSSDPTGAATFEAAVAEQQRGEYGLAMQRMKVSIERSVHPESKGSRQLYLAKMAYETGRFDQAIESCLPAVETLTGKLKLSALIGMVEWHTQCDEIDQAEQYLLQALAMVEQQPSNQLEGFAKISQAQVMFARGEQTEAVLRMEKLANDNVSSWNFRASLAERLYWMGRLDEALKHAEDAFNQAEASPRTTPELIPLIASLLGHIHYEKGEFVETLVWTSRALETPIKAPRLLASIHSLSALAYAKLGSSKSAEEHFKSAEELYSCYSDAQVNRASVAILSARRNILKSNFPHALVSLKIAEEEVRLPYEKPMIQYLYGEAYCGLGDNITARMHYELAAAWEGENLFAIKSAAQLKKLSE